MRFTNARIFTGKDGFAHGCFSVECGRFASVIPGGDDRGGVDLHGAKVIPGLVDIHTHGSAGADFSDGEEAGLRRMAAYEASVGVTSFLPTSMALPYPALSRAFTTAAAVRNIPHPGEARVMGVHMEGPFCSPEKKGAQNGAYLRVPDADAFQKLQEDCGGLIRIVTVAPELPGAEDFIRRVSPHCVVSLAHTEADYDCTRAAIAAGATHMTHLFNAMRPMLHRSPGPIAAGSESEEVMAELICDGIHIHPAAVRAAFKLFPGRVCLISDSMRACGSEEGVYDLGGQRVTLTGRRAALDDGTIAGSATDLYTCMCNAVAFGIGETEAILSATFNPARSVGLEGCIGSIAPGKCADFVVCEEDLTPAAVYIGGGPV